jgi:hypothetical protein
MLNPLSWTLDGWFFALQVASFVILGFTVAVGYFVSTRQAKEILALKVELANAQRNLLEAQERFRPRRIAREKMVAALKGRSVGTVSIVCDPTAPDAYNPLGMEIHSALHAAGWTVESMKSEPLERKDQPPNWIAPLFMQGVTIEGAENCDDGRDTAFCSLWNAFKVSGVECQAVGGAPLPKGKLRILIGPRPLLPHPPEK